MRLPGWLLNVIVMMMMTMMMIMMVMLVDGAFHMGADDCRLEKRATIKVRGEATGFWFQVFGCVA